MKKIKPTENELHKVVSASILKRVLNESNGIKLSTWTDANILIKPLGITGKNITLVFNGKEWEEVSESK